MASLVRMVTTSQIVVRLRLPVPHRSGTREGLAQIFGTENLRKIERENALKLVLR